jgi:hypothetical protein
MKVDAAALLPAVVDGIKKGKADLDDPATTLTLIKLSAAVGVKGTLNAEGLVAGLVLSGGDVVGFHRRLLSIDRWDQ